MIDRTDDDGDGFSSPACAMHEMDAAYMGFADTGEVVALLQAVHGAFRAAGRIAAALAAASGPGPDAGRMDAIRQDAAAADALLAAHIAALGATPPAGEPPVPDAAAGPEPASCRARLDRLLAWIEASLRAVLPRIRDDRLHGDLARLLRPHDSDRPIE